MARTKPWEVSDEVWERVRPLIPAAPSHAKGGRRRMDDRKAFEAIVYVLRTASNGMRYRVNWEPAQRCMIAFRNGNERAFSRQFGRPG
jgi:transposase